MRAAYRIASGLTCEFIYHAGAAVQIEARWDPARPQNLSGQALRRYRKARQSFAERVQCQMGTPILVIDSYGWSDDLLQRVALTVKPAEGRA